MTVKKLSLIQIIKHGYSDFIKNIKEYTLLTIIFLMVPYILLLLTESNQNIILNAIIVTIVILATIKYQLSILFIADNNLKKKKTHLKDLKKIIKKKFIPYLGTSIIAGFILFVIFIATTLIASIALGITPADLTTNSISIYIAITIGVVIGGLTQVLLLFPGVIAALGKQKYFSALQESINHVKKHYFKYLGYGLVLMLIGILSIGLFEGILNAIVRNPNFTSLLITMLVENILFIPITIGVIYWYRHLPKK